MYPSVSMNNDNYDPDDRIAALATPWAESAIGIIRLSGEGSIEKVDPLFKGKTALGKAKPARLYLGMISDPSERRSPG